MSLKAVVQIVGGSHIILSSVKALEDVNIVRHDNFFEMKWVFSLENRPEKKKPVSYETGFLICGGDDETRTRDLRRDRPAF